MHQFKLFPGTSLLVITCTNNHPAIRDDPGNFIQQRPIFETIKAIPVPLGYERVALGQGSFGEWLAKISLKKNGLVYLYDGSLKKNQTAQICCAGYTCWKKRHATMCRCSDEVAG